MTRKTTVDIVMFLYVVLFMYTATSKLMDHEKFAVQLGQSPMLTEYAFVLAFAVPVAEVVIAVALMFPVTRLRGFYAAYGLMVMFVTYIAILMTYDDYVPCSCGGILEVMGWGAHLVFNVVFVALAAIAVVLIEDTNNGTNTKNPSLWS